MEKLNTENIHSLHLYQFLLPKGKVKYVVYTKEVNRDVGRNLFFKGRRDTIKCLLTQNTGTQNNTQPNMCIFLYNNNNNIFF